jgi:hypothetical protein
MTLFKAFIDDSQSHGAQPLFVLAGYVGPAKMWEGFSVEWRRALAMRPAIQYFKLREALRGEGEFNGASEGLRLERVRLMRNIIEQFEPSEFSIAFRTDHFAKAAAILPPGQFQNPYFFAAFELVMRLTKNIEHFGGTLNDSLRITYDNQAMEKSRMLGGWQKLAAKLDGIEQRSGQLPPLVTDLMKSDPTWADDRSVLPLQAADMHATWFRMYLEAHLENRKQEPVPGFRKQLRGLSVVATQETLNNFAEVTREALARVPDR